MTGPRAEPLTAELVRGVRGFERLAPGWDELVLATPRPSPFLLHGLCATWWSQPGATAEPLIAVARRGERLVGALPLEVRRAAGVRIASFPGQHNAALADILLDRDEPLDTARTLLTLLQDAPYDIAWLYGLPGGSRLERCGADLRFSERVECPVLEMPDGFDAAYLAHVDGHHRREQRRRLRLLEHEGAVEFTMARTAEELVRDLPPAFEVHARRRAGRPDASGFSTPRGRRYHLALARRLGPHGHIRLLTLRLDGRPIAFDYFFVVGTTIVDSVIAFEPEFGRFSPGKYAWFEAKRQASAEGARRIEFLGRLDAYKRELVDDTEPLFVGVGLARGTRGQVAGAALWPLVEARRRARQSERIRHAYIAGLAPLRRLRARSHGDGDADERGGSGS
jgi:CelD/BcsL family acetyltransferase involved in cellulose biosynthesis